MGEPDRAAIEIVHISLGGTIQCVPEPAGTLPSLDPRTLTGADGVVPAGVVVTPLPQPPVPSAALDLQDLHRVAVIADRRVAAGAAGVVVTLGTDVLEEAAFALDLLWDRPEPLVVTAAMRPTGAPGADGAANLRAALLVAADAQARGQGCVVVLNDEVHAAWQVTKAHTGLPSAFRSVHTGPLGVVVEGRLRLLGTVPDRPLVALPEAPVFPPVALLRAAMGDDGRLVDVLVGAGYAGLVVEATGGGSVPPVWSGPLGAAAGSVPVVYTSRTGGPTFRETYGGPGSETDLVGKGLVAAGFLDGLKARVLLRLLLAAGAGHRDVVEAFEAFDRPTHHGRRTPHVPRA